MRLPNRHTSDTVAVILATGMAVSMAIITGSIAWAVINQTLPDGGLGENATQVLIGWGGGVIGVLGSYLGLLYNRRSGDKPPEEDS
jgi:hypothetical protein